MRATSLLSLALLFPSEFTLKRRERKPVIGSQSAFDNMLQDRRAEIARMVSEFGSGELHIDDLAARFHAMLLEGHTQAWMAGRYRSGDIADYGNLDVLQGSAKADLEAQWYQSFLADIRNGRYTDAEGAIKVNAIVARSNTYLPKMTATADEAMVQHGPDDAEIWWVLGATDHCEECPYLASNSPYTKATLYTFPRAGDTPCRFNCDCELKYAGGSVGFRYTA